jgi:hypothetical protein
MGSGVKDWTGDMMVVDRERRFDGSSNYSQTYVTGNTILDPQINPILFVPLPEIPGLDMSGFPRK